MTFVILGFDGADGPQKRPLHRPAHLQRLQDLDAQGKLILAGPFTDATGSLMIIEADSLEAAEAFASSDPYVVHGIFTRVEVHPFKPILPDRH